MSAKEMWRPSTERIEDSELMDFQRHIEKKVGRSFEDYCDFQHWSVESPKEFWRELLDYFPLKYSGDPNPVCTDLGFQEYGWFPELKLNFAENMLSQGKDNDVALSSRTENGKHAEWTYGDLYETTRMLQGAMIPFVGQGDVVGAYMPNIPETVLTMLGASSLGAVFSSTSSDFGVSGVLDRFGQSEPKVLVAAIGYQYNGKYYDLTERLKTLEKELPSLEMLVIVDPFNKGVDIEPFEKGIMWEKFLEMGESHTLDFPKVPFSAPLYVMYSSGTTGTPKCIVHSVGGTLLQHVKELGLHTNVKSDKAIFYFTTCGWMMWNWLVSSLFFGAKVVLYDGSPGAPSLEEFFQIIDHEKLNFFGTSPKFLRALEDSGYEATSKLESLETILSTGAPLLPEQFDFIYQKIKKDVCVSSISGGTDILGCFMLGAPTRPVYRGEIQALGLGMDVDCFSEQGGSTRDQEGELVCKQSFPSRPIYFLADEDGKRMQKAYFDRFPGIWHHGDFITLTSRETVIVFGRSDTTLNPGGVRIGTAEIYRQTETLPYLSDAICVGKKTSDGDVDVWLFLKMAEGEGLDENRIKEIKKSIRENTTPRHVPKQIHAVKDIPYTRSGKKMEMAITRILNGRKLDNIEAVANPECLQEYEQYK